MSEKYDSTKFQNNNQLNIFCSIQFKMKTKIIYLKIGLKIKHFG